MAGRWASADSDLPPKPACGVPAYGQAAIGSGIDHDRAVGSAMGADDFDQFVREVREQLWVLVIEPAFSINDNGDRARFMWPPYHAEVERLNPVTVRLALSAHGELIRTIELPMTAQSAKLAADGIIAVFEPDALSPPPIPGD
jgi:hypothetical protein